MISRVNRFHGQASLRRMQSQSQTIRGPQMALKYAPTKRPSYRLAIVVSRKVSKSAVIRNRIRRRLYESVRLLSSSFNSPVDLVLIVYDERVATIASAELCAEVRRLCVKAKLLAASLPTRDIVEPRNTP